MSERVKRKQSAARQRLITAAKELFHEKGYDKTTVLDITTRADVSKGSYYTHFSTKADILATIVIENLIRQTKEIEAIRNTPASGIEKLEKVLRLFVDHFLAEPENGDITTNTEVAFCRNELSRDVARMIVSHIGLLRQQFMQIVGEGIKDGTIRNIDNFETFGDVVIPMARSYLARTALFANAAPPRPEHFKNNAKHMVDFFIAVLSP